MTSQRLRMAGVVGLGIFLTSVVLAGSPVDQLISQLGSGKFNEREAAGREIQAIGTPALDSLRKSLHHEDAEVRRRVEGLIKAIELRAEADTALQPTRIKLDFEDRPVLDAISRTFQRIGYTVNVQGEAAKFRDRKVTIQTPELPFWEALDRLCEKASVTVRYVAQAIPPSATQASNFGFGGIQQGFSGLPPPLTSATEPRPIQITDEKPSAVPTFYAGALRIRLLSPEARKEPRSSSGEVAYTVEVAPEPKLQWYGLAAVRLEEAVDDRRQFLSLAIPSQPQARVENEEQVMIAQFRGGRRVVRFNNGGQIVQMWVGGDSNSDSGRVMGLQQWPLRLKLPENAGSSVKQLKATALARLQLPVHLTIDNIMQSEKKEHTAADGSRITITKIAKQEDSGEVIVMAKFCPSAAAFQNNLNPNLQLFDAGDKPYRINRPADVGFADNLGLTFHVQATFRPATPMSRPQKLTWTSSRVAVIEVPFELKDVPLLAKGE